MSDRPSTSKGFPHQQQPDEFNHHKVDSKSRRFPESNHVGYDNNQHLVYPGGSQNFGANSGVRELDGAAYLVDGNDPESSGASGYVVESEPSKFKPFQRNDSVGKSNGDHGGNGGHFEDPFLPDFDPSGDGNLQEAAFPPIDAGPAFGQPVDLEDIQVGSDQLP